MRRTFLVRTLALLAGVALLVVLTVPVGSEGQAATSPISPSGVELRLEPIAQDFATPLWGTNAPGLSDQLFVVDQTGAITALRIRGFAAPERFTFLDIGSSGLGLLTSLPFSTSFSEQGLLGLAFHPQYATNGLVYTAAVEPRGTSPDFPTVAGTTDSVIREWRVDDPANPASTINPSSNREVLRIGQPQANHNGGAIEFGPDGMLYIALGDGGGRDDEGPGHAATGNGQDLSETNPLGKILRIDPLARSSANGQYGVPVDNPFVGRAGVDEAWAYGFRNPFRIAFDPVTGALYAADVGQHEREEVNLIIRGGNYGWPVKEGTHLFNGNGSARGTLGPDSPGSPSSMVDPLVNYDHDDGISVTGGFVARGARVTGLEGSYVFADLAQQYSSPSGRLFHIDSAGGLRELLPTNGADHPMYITGFGQDSAGDVYVMGIPRVETAGSGGMVFRLASPASTRTCLGQQATIDLALTGGYGIGTADADVIVGTEGPDVIVGAGGNDTICGLEGDDRLFGRSGDDAISGGLGDDTIHGDRGDDELFGDGGADRIYGYADNDTIEGGDGPDRLHGNFGTDIISGGNGDDKIFGYGDDDVLDGDAGNDIMHGNFGNDVMRGGEGDDRIFGYGDDDIMSGGGGADILRGNFGDDEMSGGPGDDTLFGSAGNDQLIGGAGNDTLNGNTDDDQLDGSSGDDTLDGGTGTDVCAGKTGVDSAFRCEQTSGTP